MYFTLPISGLLGQARSMNCFAADCTQCLHRDASPRPRRYKQHPNYWGNVSGCTNAVTSTLSFKTVTTRVMIWLTHKYVKRSALSAVWGIFHIHVDTHCSSDFIFEISHNGRDMTLNPLNTNQASANSFVRDEWKIFYFFFNMLMLYFVFLHRYRTVNL